MLYFIINLLSYYSLIEAVLKLSSSDTCSESIGGFCDNLDESISISSSGGCCAKERRVARERAPSGCSVNLEVLNSL